MPKLSNSVLEADPEPYLRAAPLSALFLVFRAMFAGHFYVCSDTVAATRVQHHLHFESLIITYGLFESGNPLSVNVRVDKDDRRPSPNSGQ